MLPYPTQMLCRKSGSGSPPTPLTVSVSPAAGSVGSSGAGTWNATASTGTPPYTYSWSATSTSGSTTVSPSGSSANVSWSGLTVGGNLTVSCTVTDSLGATGSASAVMSVPRSPTYPPLTDLTFSLSGSPYIDAGKSYSHTFVATPTGGTPPLTFSWGFFEVFTGDVSSDNQAVGYRDYVDGNHTGTGRVFCRVQDATGAYIDRTLYGYSLTY